jgi:Ca-activated chloride channel family protein
MTANTAEAEDITQDVFINLFHKPATAPSSSSTTSRAYEHEEVARLLGCASALPAKSGQPAPGFRHQGDRMRTLTACFISLLFIFGAGVAPRAQSGRNRGVPKVEPPADNSPAGPSSSDAREEVADDGVVRVDTSLVMIPVSVRDRGGRYAPDLRREDFRVYEDGVEQQVAYFATVDQPFTVALVLDTSGSTDFSINEMQRAAVAFVELLQPADRVMVISFDERIDVLCEPTGDRQELSRAIRRARGGGGTRLYDAVEFTLREKLAKISGRKAVVLLTDGVDTTSRRTSRDGSLRLAEESDAIIYPVNYGGFGAGSRGGVLGQPRIPLPGGGGIIIGQPRGGGGGGTSPADYARGDAYLNELAMRTGGRLYRGTSVINISQSFAWVAEELRRQYSLGYYPKTAGRDGQRRRIKVQVTQPNLVVQARDSYIYTQKRTETDN